MRAIIFEDVEHLSVEQVADPRVEYPEDAVVQVLRAGLCGSDLHIYRGREKGLDPGTVMGHEFVGEIVEVGSKVKGFQKGDIVCSPFTVCCGDCFYCEQGLTARCENGQGFFGWVQDGKGLQGGQSEYVRVPLADTTLLKLPEVVTMEEGLLLGDNLSTGFFCADMAEIKPQGVYLVIGCGSVGLMCVLGARELGAETVYAFDPVPERLSLAEQFGATPISEREAVKPVLMEASDGRGADGVMELVGIDSAQELAFEVLRPGGILSVAGMHTAANFAFSPFDAYNKNLTYKTGRCSARAYMSRLLPLVESKKFDLSKIITHQLPLEQGVQAYDMFDNRRDGCIKVVFAL